MRRIVGKAISERSGVEARDGRADAPLRSILIVGGGAAGWMAAASLAKFLGPMQIAIRVVESNMIGTVGVGEATVPSIMDFVRRLGIDQDELIREIKATYKLGIAYRDWTRPGDVYFHPFGPIGAGMGAISFPTYWLKMFLAGEAGRLEDYSVQAMAAAEGKFAHPVHAPNNPLNKIVYALHFDASLFGQYLRRFAQALGVTRTEGIVRQVSLAPESGVVQSVTLENGETLKAD